jgi:hypothetical protein
MRMIENLITVVKFPAVYQHKSHMQWTYPLYEYIVSITDTTSIRSNATYIPEIFENIEYTEKGAPLRIQRLLCKAILIRKIYENANREADDVLRLPS